MAKLSVLIGRVHPQFNDLLFRRGRPCFFAFDLLYSDGKDWRRDGLVDRKAALRSLLQRLPRDSRLRYADHVEGYGVELFEPVCQLDLEGIVAKYRFGPYAGDHALSTWYKIRNRSYSQMVGREKLFERDRHNEPVLGWHTCETRLLGCGSRNRINLTNVRSDSPKHPMTT
jgi:ATP-dependent DNA ligase